MIFITLPWITLSFLLFLFYPTYSLLSHFPSSLYHFFSSQSPHFSFHIQLILLQCTSSHLYIFKSDFIFTLSLINFPSLCISLLAHFSSIHSYISTRFILTLQPLTFHLLHHFSTTFTFHFSFHSLPHQYFSFLYFLYQFLPSPASWLLLNCLTSPLISSLLFHCLISLSHPHFSNTSSFLLHSIISPLHITFTFSLLLNFHISPTFLLHFPSPPHPFIISPPLHFLLSNPLTYSISPHSSLLLPHFPISSFCISPLLPHSLSEP